MKTPSPDIARLEAAVRRSAAADSFAELLVSVDQYTSGAAEQARTLRNRPDLLALQSSVDRLFDWVEVMARTTRAADALVYDRLSNVSQYAPPARDPRGTVADA